MTSKLPLTDDGVVNAIGELYRQFAKLRDAGLVQEEYEAMNTLAAMLIQDKQHILRKYPQVRP